MKKNKLIIIAVISAILVIGINTIITKQSKSSNESTNNVVKTQKTMLDNSLIIDYRKENKNYFETLKNIVYNSTAYDNGKVEKDYVFKDVDFDSLGDIEYYTTVNSMYSLTHQQNIDKKMNESDLSEFDKKIAELDKLAKEKSIA